MLKIQVSLFSVGGVGFDINCGVRLLRTNLWEKDVLPIKEQLAQSLFDHIPVGVGSKGEFYILKYAVSNIAVCCIRYNSNECERFRRSS